MDYFWSVVWAVSPTILVGLAFWFIMWSILRIDRHERNAQAKVEAQERARLAARPSAN
jgi:flagellar biosynthesis/type III secretory pathway M-ring protein FliF/YscJ